MRDRVQSVGAIVIACWMLGCGGPDLSLDDYAITKIAAPEQDPVFGVDTLATRAAGAGTWMGINDAGTWMASGGAYRNPAGPVHVNLIDASGAVVDSWMIDWAALGFSDYGEVQAFTVDDRGRFWVLYYQGWDPALIEINISTGEIERRIPCPAGFTRKQYLAYADGHLFVGGQVETYLLEYDVATGALVKDYASTIVNDLHRFGTDIEGKGSHDLELQYTLADIAATDLCYRDNTLWAVQRFKVPPAVVEPQIVGLDPRTGLPNSSVMAPIAVPGDASLACTAGGWLYGGDRGHGWVGLGEQPDDPTQRSVVPYRETGSSVTVHDGKAWMLDRTRHLIMVVDLI